MTTNNDIIRQIRYIFNYTDVKMMEIYSSTGFEIARQEVSDWLKRDEDPDNQLISDTNLAIFLNGLINEKRGKKDGEPPKPEKFLNNNIILRKLKIALNYKDEDMLAVLDLAGRQISKHELSAFFRDPKQKQYRPCKDQILRNFLQGLKIKLRSQIG